MNIVIVEDEVAAARRLQKLISELVPKAKLIAHFESVEDTVNWCLQNPHPDLFFMDIQLADGLSFEIFEHVSINAPVIFTTAFDEYAIKAFTVNSIDYLLKPIERNLLERALHKYEVAATNENEKLKTIVAEILSTRKNFRDRFLVRKGEAYYPLMLNEIAYFYAEDKVVFAKTKQNQRALIDFTIDSLEKCLNPSLFFRANRSFLISIDAISKVTPGFNGKLNASVQPGQEHEIIISRERAADFKNWLGK